MKRSHYYYYYSYSDVQARPRAVAELDGAFGADKIVEETMGILWGNCASIAEQRITNDAY